MNPIQSVHELGQSLWLDAIRRDWFDSGALAENVAGGELRGVTSNPTIFEQILQSSESYAKDMRRFAQLGWTAERIYDQIAIDDIRTTADSLLPLFEQTNGRDGYVSIEVNPEFAEDATRTMDQANRLWAGINRPNVMITIPATGNGIAAIERVIRLGINVNATLIFSLERYIEVIEAYLAGLEGRLDDGRSLDHVNSVASFFVSPVDTMMDEQLREIIQRGGEEGDRASSLLGKIAIASSKLAYAQYIALFQGERFEYLAANGARVQRPLWASTSTKNPDYPDTYYVDQLIGPDTVNSISEATFTAFKDHGSAKPTLTENISTARSQLQALESLGISLSEVAVQLEKQGIDQFVGSFQSSIRTIEEKASVFREELSALQPQLSETLAEVDREGVCKRLWQEDVTLWVERDREKPLVRRWLGWLAQPVRMAGDVDALVRLADAVKSSEIKTLVLLGSPWAIFTAEILSRILDTAAAITVHTLCTANPDVIRALNRNAAPEESLYLIVDSLGDDGLEKYLRAAIWEHVTEILGERAKDHFIVLTTEDSPLRDWAGVQGIQNIIDVESAPDPWYFPFNRANLFPAALAGADLPAFIHGGVKMTRSCGPLEDVGHNPGLFLGAVLAAASRSGRHTLRLFADPPLEPLSKWIEGLFMAGKGNRASRSIRVEGEPSTREFVPGDDALIVYLRTCSGDDSRRTKWIQAGNPVLVLDTGSSTAALGELLVQWQIGAAVAQHLLSMNPTDLDGLHRSREAFQRIVQRLERKGELNPVEAIWQGNGVRLRAVSRGLKFTGSTLEDLVEYTLNESRVRGKLAMHFYTTTSQTLLGKVGRLERALGDQIQLLPLAGLSQCAVVSSASPEGVLTMLMMVKPRNDLAVPEKDFTFSQLYEAQCRGDFAALQENESAVVRLDFNTKKSLGEFLAILSKAARSMKV